nr:hypothetical protein [Lysinibacillus timonensis]
MDEIKIIVNKTTLFINNTNNIVGEIYIEKNGHNFFPNEKWTDFVVVILYWWTKKLRSFEYAKVGEKTELEFMDGPLLLRLEKVNDHEVNLLGIKKNLINEEVIFEAQTLFDDLKKKVVNISNSVIGYTKQKSWENYDIENLYNEVKPLLK